MSVFVCVCGKGGPANGEGKKGGTDGVYIQKRLFLSPFRSRAVSF